MLAETITVTLPEPILRKLQKAAQLTYRSIDDLLAATVDAALPAPTGLPSDLENELAAMQLFSDEALWAATHPSFSEAEQERLQQINHTGGQYPLTNSEQAEQSTLLKAYYRSVLRRAQAFAILKQRGHEVQVTPLL